MRIFKARSKKIESCLLVVCGHGSFSFLFGRQQFGVLHLHCLFLVWFVFVCILDAIRFSLLSLDRLSVFTVAKSQGKVPILITQGPHFIQEQPQETNNGVVIVFRVGW